MKLTRYVNVCALLSVLACASGSGLHGGWKPEWKIGDWWTVKVRATNGILVPESLQDISKSAILAVQYRVVGEETISGRPCFAVDQRTIDHLDAAPLVYYYDKANLRVLMVASRAHPNVEDPRDAYGTPWNYDWTHSAPFYDAHNHYGEVPAFPLALTGPVADSLGQGQIGPRGAAAGAVSQFVTTGSVSDFKGLMVLTDTVCAAKGDCYSVQLQTWQSDSISTRQAWVPGLPWFLFSETTYPLNGGRKQLFVRWLADCSSRHKK